MNTLRTGPGTSQTPVICLNTRQPEKGVGERFIKPLRPRVPLLFYVRNTTSSQEDAFLGPPDAHTPVSKDWVQPSSNDSDNPTQQTQCDHSSLRAGETPFPLLGKETLSQAKPAGEGSASP